MSEIPKTYDSKKVEDEIYRDWEESGNFQPKEDREGPSFSIAMPPPNATGELHLGHAMMLAIQDILIRYHRMKGDKTLWLPGTDHAAIATNAKVEQLLREEGKTKHDLGREKFVKRIEDFIAESQSTIQTQIRKMGASCDWSRERYTFEPALHKAVNEVFVRMYKDGLIYRGKRIVNWCPQCASTLADDEVEHKTTKAKFYHMKYGPVVIGTARPETKFLDKTIVVHPEDERYKDMIGKTFVVPWIEGEVEASVIADEVVDKDFGTGAMTITPAHSFVDFDLAQKHNLPVVQIIDEAGNLTNAAGSFAGKNAAESRDTIVKQMQEKGLIDHIDEDYEHELSVCYRCGTTIEPLVSKQWFIDVENEFRIANHELRKTVGKEKASIKEISNAVVREGAIQIIPDRFNKTYFHWMENLRDWCISRQLWFGHRMPVWYCGERMTNNELRITEEGEAEHIVVSIDKPEKCPECGGTEFEQDPDVLDTWFSSGMWTFSTLGWPEETQDLKDFHPTSVLETGYDILFFWVARMIIMTTYVRGEVPFKTVYLHGMVRDKQGRKMSKSLGNGIDPLEMIEKYGSDAVRLSLVIGTTPGNDTAMYEEKIAGYRNFVNKIWNISRYIIMRREKQQPDTFYEDNFTLADHWISVELIGLVKDVNRHIESYRFSQAGEAIYEFMWHKLADWHIETVKIENKEHHQTLLEFILEKCLVMLHPFVPFVTEEIWKELYSHEGKMIHDKLIIEPWVTSIEIVPEPEKAQGFEKVQEIITAIRTIRNEHKIPAGEKVSLQLETQEKGILDAKDLIETLSRAEIGTIRDDGEKAEAKLGFATLHVSVPEKRASEEDPEELKKYIQSLATRLHDEKFLQNAPKEVVEKEKARLREARAKVDG